MVFDERYLSLEDGEYGYLCEYFPKNKSFYDERTQNFILGFKQGKEECINLVFNQLYPQLGEDFAIAVVPSSSVEKNFKSPCHVLAGKILDKAIREGKYVVDATDCLYRHTSITPAHDSKGPRSKQIHLDSIKVIHPRVVQDLDVLVLDDVTTSGSSFEAAYDLLKAAGAKKIISFAVGRTVTSVLEDVLRYGFIFDLDMTLFDTSSLAEYRNTGNWEAACAGARLLSPYPGIPELFHDIRSHGGDIAIVTASKRRYAEILANKLGIYGANLVTYEDFRLRDKDETNLFYNKMLRGQLELNPKLELYLRAKHVLGTFEGTMFVVGDMPNDIYPAQQLGMHALQAQWGNKVDADTECQRYSSVDALRQNLPNILSAADAYRRCLDAR